MGLWGIYWTSVGDLTQCVCVCSYLCVCFLDCRVGSHIMVLFHLCYSHSKAIRFYTKPWSWELWGWECCNWQAAILRSTSLHSWSPLQYWALLQLLLHLHTHTLTVTLSDLCSPHMGTSVFGRVHGTDISELPQTSAGLIGSTLFVPAPLWMLLMPLAHCLGVAFVPSGTNRRLLWLFQHQWHSWLVPFSMLDLASLERMWLEGHTEAMKWGVRGWDGGEQQLCFLRGHFAVELDKKTKPSHKNTLNKPYP